MPLCPPAAASTNILQMGANVWLNFCNDAGIVHPTQRGCTVQDLQVRQGSAGRSGLLGASRAACGAQCEALKGLAAHSQLTLHNAADHLHLRQL